MRQSVSGPTKSDRRARFCHNFVELFFMDILSVFVEKGFLPETIAERVSFSNYEKSKAVI
jgi:hypothetical protein